MASGWVWEAANFVNAGFWRLKAPETSIWAPEDAFGPKKAIFRLFFIMLSIFVRDYFYEFSSRHISRCWFLAPEGARNQHLGA